MTLSMFIMLFAVVAFVATIAEIAINRQKQLADTAQKFSLSGIQEAVTTSVDEVKTLSANLIGKNYGELAEPFKFWANQNIEQKELKQWLNSLSSEGLQALTEKLAGFCADLNLDLRWLVQQRLDVDPQLQQTTANVVLTYCEACWRAIQVQPNIETFKAYLAIAENPASKSNRVVSQQLLAELQSEKLIAPPEPQLFVATEEERQTLLTQIFNEAADKDRQKFYTIVQNVVHAAQGKSS